MPKIRHKRSQYTDQWQKFSGKTERADPMKKHQRVTISEERNLYECICGDWPVGDSYGSRQGWEDIHMKDAPPTIISEAR